MQVWTLTGTESDRAWAGLDFGNHEVDRDTEGEA
jgi:hypothetical protein